MLDTQTVFYDSRQRCAKLLTIWVCCGCWGPAGLIFWRHWWSVHIQGKIIRSIRCAPDAFRICSGSKRLGWIQPTRCQAGNERAMVTSAACLRPTVVFLTRRNTLLTASNYGSLGLLTSNTCNQTRILLRFPSSSSIAVLLQTIMVMPTYQSWQLTRVTGIRADCYHPKRLVRIWA